MVALIQSLHFAVHSKTLKTSHFNFLSPTFINIVFIKLLLYMYMYGQNVDIDNTFETPFVSLLCQG